jgi:hypothetical protein
MLPPLVFTMNAEHDARSIAQWFPKTAACRAAMQVE